MVRIGSGWTPPENYFQGPDGTYQVTLVQIGVTDRQTGVFKSGATRTYEGQFGEKTVQDWTFALDDGSIIEASVAAPKQRDGDEVIHPKSTYYAYVTALAGKPLAEGVEFDPQKHLVGRMANATIARDPNGYPRIVTLGAIATARQAAPAPAPAPAPVPVAAGVADELPF